MKFEILENNQTSPRTYRWRLLADSGRLIARSRKYNNLRDCQNDVHYVALSAVSISLDRLLSPDAFSLADFISSPDSPSTTDQPTSPSADFFSAATPAPLHDGIFEN